MPLSLRRACGSWTLLQRSPWKARGFPATRILQVQGGFDKVMDMSEASICAGIQESIAQFVNHSKGS